MTLPYILSLIPLVVQLSSLQISYIMKGVLVFLISDAVVQNLNVNLKNKAYSFFFLAEVKGPVSLGFSLDSQL